MKASDEVVGQVFAVQVSHASNAEQSISETGQLRYIHDVFARENLKHTEPKGSMPGLRLAASVV